VPREGGLLTVKLGSALNLATPMTVRGFVQGSQCRVSCVFNSTRPCLCIRRETGGGAQSEEASIGIIISICLHPCTRVNTLWGAREGDGREAILDGLALARK
jgi:hypothetical protein